jgi:hypothetical protein
MRSLTCAVLLFSLFTLVAVSRAQQAQSNPVPNLISYSGMLIRSSDMGVPAKTVGVTFALYGQQDGGAPIWQETQNVTPDSMGHFTVLLGSTTAEGIPANLFVTQEQCWLGVEVQGQPEQPRVMLVSVPYALKAGDAATVGGLPPSAFLRAAPSRTVALAEAPSSPNPGLPSPALGGTGTPGFVPIWSNSTTLGNSVMFQSGTGAAAKVGINLATPASTLDVNGGGTIRGLLKHPASGTATATTGSKSQAEDFVASSFNSGTRAAVNQTFQWQAEPVANNTSNPSGSLNLLFASGAATPAETGLKISSKGIFSFATGQTFPGAGTIRGVTAGTYLTGGGTTGVVTLSLDTSKVPRLNAANNFVGNQTIAGNLSDTGNISTTGQITATKGASFAGNVAGEVVTVIQQGSDNGVYSQTSSGVALTGFSGALSGTTYGVIGQAVSASGTGVWGEGGATGVLGKGTVGVMGQSTSGGCSPPASRDCPGGLFVGYSAPIGSNAFGTDGVDTRGGNADHAFAQAGAGVFAAGGSANPNTGDSAGPGGVFLGGDDTVSAGDGVFVQHGSGSAGRFFGDVLVTGVLSASAKNFEIDDPLDPANRYLVHSSVESSEMMNIYTGNIVTDAQGEATVQLPEWFEAINTDFRYQLTVIGQFAQAIVAREIQEHQFLIRTSAPNVKVSWQVAGVRQDAFAKSHPLVVEQEKEVRLKGFYIHPELYGAPDEKQIEWARHPQIMRRTKEHRQTQIRISANTSK